jgi:putative FmdB family regulatory protein
MPLYDYACKECDETFEKTVKIAQMSEKQECPFCGSMNTEKFIGGAPALGDPVRLGIRKPDELWKDTLREIAKKNPQSTIKDNSSYI